MGLRRNRREGDGSAQIVSGGAPPDEEVGGGEVRADLLSRSRSNPIETSPERLVAGRAGTRAFRLSGGDSGGPGSNNPPPLGATEEGTVVESGPITRLLFFVSLTRGPCTLPRPGGISRALDFDQVPRIPLHRGTVFPHTVAKAAGV